MNRQSQNFWSLYYDFIHMFKDLKYYGISLPYLCHFRSLFRENKALLEGLGTRRFSKQLYSKVKDKGEFQHLFTTFKSLHSIQNQNKDRRKGKIALYNAANLLRFPPDVIQTHFPPGDAVLIQDGIRDENGPGAEKVLKGKKGSGPFSSQVVILSDYSKDIQEDVASLQAEADALIKKHMNHPLVSDPSFPSFFNHQISEICHRIVESHHLFKQVEIGCIIFSSTHYFQSRTMAIVAAEWNIPTICMQHGIIGSEHGYMPKVADVDAVYGTLDVEWFKNIGVSESSVEIVGHPRFDPGSQSTTFTREEVEKRLGFDFTKKTILLIVRGTTNIKDWRKLLSQLEKDGEYQVIIKDFPLRVDHPLSEQFLSARSSPYHLYELLPHVDVVVSYFSTVGLEAMLAGKPVFFLDTSTDFYSGYYDSLAAMTHKDATGLARLVHNYFNDGDYEAKVLRKTNKFLAQAYPYRNSIQRLMNLIEKMTK